MVSLGIYVALVARPVLRKLSFRDDRPSEGKNEVNGQANGTGGILARGDRG